MRTLLGAAGLLLTSGFCALVYQTVWLRELRLVFGASTPSTAATLGLFMAGLGAGGLWLGRRADRHARPLLLYALLEVGITVTAALSPLLLDGARALYLSAGGSSRFGDGGATLLRLALAALVIAGPALLMGGTLPAAARAVTTSGDVGRRGLALLYGANTIGAVAGVALSTFWLFERYGFRTTLWLACLLNLVLATLAGAMATRPLPDDGTEGSSPAPAEVDERPASDSSTPPSLSPRWLVLLAAFASGFSFFLAELVWYRMGAPILGGSTYTFGIILACALFGIGVGGLLYGVLPPARASVGLLGVTFSLEAVLLLAPYALGDEIALLAAALRSYGMVSFASLATGWTVVCVLLVVPAAVVAGYQLPLLVALAGEGPGGVGRDVGDVYAANTAGSVSGSLLGGFVLLPVLTAPGAWVGAALLLLVVALGAAALSFVRQRAIAFVSLSLIVVASAFTSLDGPSALWRHTGIGAGRAQLAFLNGEAREHFEAKLNAFLLAEHEGRESALAFSHENGLAVFVNGKSDGNASGDAPTFVGHALLPAILHGAPKSAFVIGLGTGQTAGWLADVPGMERVDVAEIEPDMVDFARRCAETNRDALENANLRLRFGDGREALMTSGERYDIIASEPSNPYRAGVASFYTREFYRAVSEHLEDDGWFAQWVQGYEIDLETLRIVIATLRSVFPHVSVWRGMPNDFFLMATKQPQVHDVDTLRALLRQEPYSSGLGRVMGIYDVEGLLAAHVASSDLTRRLAPGALINTDDFPALEFRFARSVGRVGGPLPFELFSASHWRGLDRPTLAGDVDWTRVGALRRRAYDVVGSPAPPQPAAPGSEADAAFYRAYLASDLASARAVGPEVNVPGHDGFALVCMADVLSTVASERAAFEAALAQVRAIGLPTEAALLELSRAIGVKGEVADRSPLITAALSALREDPWVPRPLVKHVLLQLRVGQLSEQELRAASAALAKGPFAGYVFHYEQQLTWALVLDRLRRDLPRECVQLFDGFVQEEIMTLSLKAACFERHAPERYPAAAAELAALQERKPASIEALLSPTGLDESAAPRP